MSKVTSKLQVTIPKEIARAHGIEPGTRIVFESAGDAIRIRIVDPDGKAAPPDSGIPWRLGSFDKASARVRKRQSRLLEAIPRVGKSRGWKREDLYERGLPG